MEIAKTKKSVRRRSAKAGNSPMPAGPLSSACGHSGCGPSTCKVRYCGPTTSIRDHHIMHAASGVSHIWAAAIITGLAIVLTGAIAFNSVQAQSSGGDAENIARIMQRLDRIEQQLKDLSGVKEVAPDAAADAAQ